MPSTNHRNKRNSEFNQVEVGKKPEEEEEEEEGGRASCQHKAKFGKQQMADANLLSDSEVIKSGVIKEKIHS